MMAGMAGDDDVAAGLDEHGGVIALMTEASQVSVCFVLFCFVFIVVNCFLFFFDWFVLIMFV
jgi:hypothetical protein